MQEEASPTKTLPALAHEASSSKRKSAVFCSEDILIHKHAGRSDSFTGARPRD
jgi:hypothetical protein